MAGLVEQDIVGLHVAMHDAVAVRVAERVRDLPGDARGVAQRETVLLLEHLPERRPVEAPHDDVQDFVLVAPDFVDRHDVRVLEAGAGSRLAHEPLGESRRRRETEVEHLDGHVVPQRIVAHPEHRRESAFAQHVSNGKFLAEGFLEAATQRGEIERHDGRET